MESEAGVTPEEYVRHLLSRPDHDEELAYNLFEDLQDPGPVTCKDCSQQIERSQATYAGTHPENDMEELWLCADCAGER